MQYFILVTGLMSSGKSTIMSEYVQQFPVEKFVKPPIKVSYLGMEFEFIDSTFALKKNDMCFNFYELDAPTIQKWVQFIQIADLIIIVNNQSPKIVYGTHKKLIEAVKANIKEKAPIIFVANNSSNFNDSKLNIEKIYQIKQFNSHLLKILHISPGEIYFDEKHGMRVNIKKDELNILFSTAIQQIIKNSNK